MSEVMRWQGTHLPVRSRARAVARPSPDEVPVTTTSFLSPNISLACLALSVLPTVGIFQSAMNLKPEAAARTPSSRVGLMVAQSSRGRGCECDYGADFGVRWCASKSPASLPREGIGWRPGPGPRGAPVRGSSRMPGSEGRAGGLALSARKFWHSGAN